MAITPKEVAKLQLPTQPRLPSATANYDRVATDQTNSILRLFFNQILSVFTGLFGTDTSGQYTGGKFLSFPYAAVQRTTNKTFTANTATEITFDQNDALNGVTNPGTNGLTVQQPGWYNYQFSIQFANTNTQIHTAWVWLRVNNVDVQGTASKFDCNAKHGTSDGYLIAACNFYIPLNAGDYVSLWAAVDNAALYMEAYTAQTSPFVHPSIPSVVATLSFVSNRSA